MKNPWETQATLMEISGQIAPRPQWGGVNCALGEGPTLLYAALTMEELGETLLALSKMLVLVSSPGVDGSAAYLRSAVDVLEYSASQLTDNSASVRSLIKWSGAAGHKLILDPNASSEKVQELADGLTDTAVTLFGMGVSAGIPADACYEEVQRSNLSKANPDTGVIEKDASGKWIKGSNYTKPNLASILGFTE